MPTPTNNPKPDAGTQAKQEIDIFTEQDRWGMWSYDFVLNGEVYQDHDYQSRANALEAARSHARSIFNQ